LEATTGWRFVVEELQAVGAQGISPSRRRPRPGGGRDARQERSPQITIALAMIDARDGSVRCSV
jgi:hypothetical protein